MDEKLLKRYFANALKHFNNAERIFNVTLPIIDDKKLYLKVIDETYKSIIDTISNIILVNYSKFSKVNFEVFIKKYPFVLNKKEIKTLFFLLKIHEDLNLSELEFVKNNKLVLFLPDSKFIIINKKTIKSFISLAKKLIFYLKRKAL
jgi:hypothetical protein